MNESHVPNSELNGRVLKVKKFESGIVKDPITVSSNTTIQEVIDLTKAKGISGVPVVDNNETVGIVTHRDWRYENDLNASVSKIMTPKEKLVTVSEDASEVEVLSLLHKHRIEKVLVVDNDFSLKGLITAKDFQKATDFPLASKDSNGALLVGAAVGVGDSTDERVSALQAVGVDVINCTFQSVDLTDGQYRFQVFGAPVFFGCCTDSVVERPCLVVSAKFAP